MVRRDRIAIVAGAVSTPTQTPEVVVFVDDKG
jgi:hypothetical protein